MHSARRERMMSKTVLPTMIDSGNSMVFYESLADHDGVNTVSRYGVPRSAHRNSTVGSFPFCILDLYRLIAAYTVPLEPPTSSPWVMRSSRHASTVSRSGTSTTSSMIACDNNGGTM